MWTRSELKESGRLAMKANYWRSVGAGLLLTIATGGSIARTSKSSLDHFQDTQQSMESIPQSDMILIVIAVLIAVAFVFVVSSAFKILLLNPLQVGCRHFFHENLKAPASINEVLYGYQNGFGRNLLTMLIADVFILLWGLLLIIPGIIKAYSYRMVPYILTEEPDLAPMEVINRSRQMMEGHKLNAFVLDLSFIGWYLLSAVTFGLAGIFYAFPYKAGTDAALYDAIRAEQGYTY